MGKSNISYLDWDVTCVEGCTRISAGCDHCYAQDYLKRFKKPMGLALHPDRLERDMAKLARIKEPQVVGIAFTGDLFHDDVPFEFIDKVMHRIAYAPQHTYLFLTKRPKRMAEYFAAHYEDNDLQDRPASNLWPGASVEDQATADDRIPKLLSIPAAHHWVSIEPMLGPVEIKRWIGQCCCCGIHDQSVTLPCGHSYCYICTGRGHEEDHSCDDHYYPNLDWVVVGCESGPSRRPADPDTYGRLVEQCPVAGVPLFIKQAGQGGKLVKMPWFRGQVWDQTPWGDK